MGLISRRGVEEYCSGRERLAGRVSRKLHDRRRAAVHYGGAVDDRVHLRSGPGGGHFEDLSMTLR